MGWEFVIARTRHTTQASFNPSFLLDGLGIPISNVVYDADGCFNPSFLLDGLGIRVYEQ